MLQPDLALSSRQAFAEQRRNRLARRLNAFERVVERCRTEWKLVVAEAALTSSLDRVLGDPMAALCTRTAIESVTDRMNEAFAGLEIALLDDDLAACRAVDAAKAGRAPVPRLECLN